jgi:hypothetical protein
MACVMLFLACFTSQPWRWKYMFPRNVGWLSPGYTAFYSYLGRYNSTGFCLDIGRRDSFEVFAYVWVMTIFPPNLTLTARHLCRVGDTRGPRIRSRTQDRLSWLRFSVVSLGLYKKKYQDLTLNSATTVLIHLFSFIFYQPLTLCVIRLTAGIDTIVK